ncbi:MAG TPA: LamG domain-containing protein [Armatimonadetes bacterium]|nr:LamG domain-containing protein [Armatimonadota bacterium]
MGNHLRYLLMLLPAVVPGRVEAGVTFYAGFEGTVEARAVGSGTGVVEGGEVKFAPGKRGLALLSGDGLGWVSYAVEGNLRLEEGSIEFWVCPQNWSGDDNKFHVFFEAKAQGWLLIYCAPYYGGMLLTSDRTDVWTRVSHSVRHFRPGQWHHLVATWSRREICLYLDGQPSARRPWPRRPAQVGDRFYLGDRPWHLPRNAQSLVDELYLYDRALTEREVQWLYAQASQRAAGEDVPNPVTPLVSWAAVRPFPSQSQLRVEVDLNPRHRVQQLTGTVRLEPPAGTQPASLQRLKARQAQALLSYSELPQGTYQVRINLQDKATGRTDETIVRLVSPGPPVWRGNRIGCPTTPPPPWSPVEARSKGVQVWGRRYELGALGLPVQIESAGVELLAAPIKLRCQVDGRPVQWRSASASPLRGNTVQVQGEGSAVSELGTLRWQVTAEFDGLLRYDLTLEPRPGVAVEALELVFPLRASEVSLHYLAVGYPVGELPGAFWGAAKTDYYPGDPATLRGTLPAGEGTVVQTGGVVYWWLGNEERGLTAFCESDEAWAQVDGQDGFRVERTGEQVNVIWAFARQRWRLPRPWRFTFGLQATPVKPKVRWRWPRLVREPDYARGLPPVVGGNVAILWVDRNLMPYHGYPEAKDPAKYRALVERLQGEGKKVVPYSLLLCLDPNAPEAFYLEEWKNGRMGDSTPYRTHLLGLYPQPDWIDFIVWKNARYVRQFDLDGLYHDSTGVFPSIMGTYGRGYERAGQVRPTYPFFATRKLYQRIYTMLKEYGRERGKDTFMIAHTSLRPLVPVISFCDAYLDGEQFWGRVKDDYLEVMPLDHIRTEFMGHNLGVRPFFLPELHTPEQREKLTPQVVGLALLHDFNLWPIFCDREHVNRVYRLLDEFGFAEAQFLPYWRNADLIAGQSEAVKCTVYLVKGPEPLSRRRALLCLVNLTRQPQVTRLRIDWAQLGFRTPPHLRDAFTGQVIASAGGQLQVEIEPLNYRLLVVSS